jgi:hypothetical protein
MGFTPMIGEYEFTDEIGFIGGDYRRNIKCTIERG